jgi:RNA polymerase sigma-70 factor (family 1)
LTSAPLSDDSTLLARVATGDEAAFNTLFERYRDKLFHYLVRITKSPEISEEIVIDIFVKLWVGRELIEQVGQLEPFLHKVAYHRAIDFLRTASRHTRLQKIYIERMEQAPEKRADELLIDAQSRQLLQKAILSLPPQRKLIYTLSREQGLTHEQIATALNLSRNTVKNSMMAAVRSISEFLRQHDSGKMLGMLFFFS